MTFTLISCPTADSSSGDSSSSNNNNNNEPAKVCGLDNPEKINVLSQDVGLYHILLDICTNEDIEISFAVTTSATAETKADLTGKLGYITRKFTKGVTRPVFLAVKADKTKTYTYNSTTDAITGTLTFADDALSPNTPYYVHLYHDTTGTKLINFTTKNYPTANPGDVITLSPPDKMTYEVKLGEPILITYYGKALAFFTITIDGKSISSCDAQSNCSPPHRREGADNNDTSNQIFWSTVSGGAGGGTPTLAHNMYYANTAGIAIKKNTHLEGNLKFEIGSTGIFRTMKIQIVTE